MLAIDGMSASGKSTLAQEVADKYGGSVVHMDDFFLPAELRTNKRLETPGGNIHYERFKELYEEYVKKYYQPDFNQNC